METPLFHKSKSLTFVTSMFVIVYLVGAFFLFTAWLGVQSISPATWRPGVLSPYAVVFLIGAVSGFGVLKGKRWGVYGLAATWVLTGILNVTFPAETSESYQALNVGIGLIVWFFLSLLSVWEELE